MTENNISPISETDLDTIIGGPYVLGNASGSYIPDYFINDDEVIFYHENIDDEGFVCKKHDIFFKEGLLHATEKHGYIHKFQVYERILKPIQDLSELK